jgi:hypothetical protein
VSIAKKGDIAIMDSASMTSPGKEEFLNELQAKAQDPVHIRLIKAYCGDDPVKSMEEELSEILLEVFRSES